MALPGSANRVDEWSVPNQPGTPTDLDRNRDRNRIAISIPIPISGMAHARFLYFNQTTSESWRFSALTTSCGSRQGAEIRRPTTVPCPDSWGPRFVPV